MSVAENHMSAPGTLGGLSVTPEILSAWKASFVGQLCCIAAEDSPGNIVA